MDNLYLDRWLRNFPTLGRKLSKEQRGVLNEINPSKYVLHNLTRDWEVIRIIDDHMPQASKWINRFPDLKNLPKEDYIILDRIVYSQFEADLVTENDIRNIIKYRKEKKAEDENEARVQERAKFFNQHKEEIDREERERNRISKLTRIFMIVFLILASTTVVCITQKDFPRIISYSVLTTLFGVTPLILLIARLYHLNKHTIIPKPLESVQAKLGVVTKMSLASLFGCFIGEGIFFGSAITYGLYGWYPALSQVYTGAIVTGVAFVLFILFASISRK